MIHIPDIFLLPISRRTRSQAVSRRRTGRVLGVILAAALAVSACQTVKRDRLSTPSDPVEIRVHRGSGFYIDDKGHVLTNHHVVDDCRRIVVKQRARPMSAVIVGADASRDLALLKTEKTPRGHASFSASRPLASAESLFALGYPTGRKHGRHGHISGYFKTDNPVSVVFAVAHGQSLFEMGTYEAIAGGNSGGPVMNRAGAVVGVLSAHLAINLNTGYALRGDVVRDFLDNNGVAYVTEPGIDAWLTDRTLFSKAESFTFPIICYH